ncbi:MAG: indolepyruvate ferredoxin oxidoreductase subunit alpha [Ruminococcus sp.]|nr:indolepyruvate ferredoxin oxidoreductase subunit alpha [Ruminococcus sp.]
MRKLLLGNEAIAQAAIESGVGVVCGYPGTPSTEILETAARLKADAPNLYIEWSTNEKAAVEVAAGAAYSGVRVLVTMKQVGLNVASDPVMCLSYIGVKGGMVIVVADDPGPISSQTEQDTRHFAEYAHIPVLDPSSPEEAYLMTKAAFLMSQRLGKPVILRPTTKVCHASATIQIAEYRIQNIEDRYSPLRGEHCDDLKDLHRELPAGAPRFVKDPRWVIFPPLAYRRHNEIAEMLQKESESATEFDKFYNEHSRYGIAAGGVTWAILNDVLIDLDVIISRLKIGRPHPAPLRLADTFLAETECVLVLEELDPVIEDILISRKGVIGRDIQIMGKRSGFVSHAGELLYADIKKYVCDFLGLSNHDNEEDLIAAPDCTPVRAPVLCAGCPHRASFYAVKTAAKGKNPIYCGDIGCYTLGNAKPLETTDTCLCMGAGITIAQGIKHSNPDTTVFGFIGDSTFFASGITGLANAVYNNVDVNIIILDNRITAMTGGQPHPGTGKTMMNTDSPPIDIEAVVKALGVGFVKKCNPFDQVSAVETVKSAVDFNGTSVVIFEAPCINLIKKPKLYTVEGCIGCMRCVNEIGCPSIFVEDKTAKINSDLCYGCGLCQYVCKAGKIKEVTL